MNSPKAPKPPADLSLRSRRLWLAVLEDYHLSPAELELLRQALVALDRADQAAAAIVEHGLVVLDRYGSPKANPAADIESRARGQFARIVAQLGVKVIDEQALSPTSRKARAAANARWSRSR